MSDVVLDVNQSLGGKKWLWRAPFLESDALLRLTRTHDLPDVLARVLMARGVPEDDMDGYLQPKLAHSCPDPFVLKDMEKGAQRLATAMQRREKVAVLGDYDVDGTTSVALFVHFFRACGCEDLLIPYIPDRIREGYGPNVGAIRMLQERGATLIVTVDCGTCAVEPLQSASVDVIVVDHHQMSGGVRPPCLALINPKQEGDCSALDALAAVGLTFLLFIAVNRLLRQLGFYRSAQLSEPNLMDWLDLVALGTVCDMVPLTGLNRTFVAQGLRSMMQRPNAGIQALWQVARPESAFQPSAYHLGFTLGPRINAGGRVSCSSMGLELLTTADVFARERLAHQLDALNFERQRIETETLSQAIVQADGAMAQGHPVVVVHAQGWHVGVIGIVASRLVAHTRRPSLVIAFNEGDDMGKGSGRSVPGIDLGAFIHEAVRAGHLMGGGGHAMAVGFSLKRSDVPGFISFMHTQLAPIFRQQEALPSLRLDGLLLPSGATADLVTLLDKAGPYGQGNPVPCFAIPDVRIMYPRIVGSDHISCFLYAENTHTRLRAIAFRVAHTPLAKALQTTNQVYHVAGTLNLNTWQDRTHVQLVIEDVACAN